MAYLLKHIFLDRMGFTHIKIHLRQNRTSLLHLRESGAVLFFSGLVSSLEIKILHSHVYFLFKKKIWNDFSLTYKEKYAIKMDVLSPLYVISLHMYQNIIFEIGFLGMYLTFIHILVHEAKFLVP